jgi:hypothetical protein
MRPLVRTMLAAVALALPFSASVAEPYPVVARILGDELRCAMRPARAAQACTYELLQRVRLGAEQAYIAAHGLAATDDEVAALQAYNRDFEQRDRAQRTAKLAEVERRLAHAPETSPERVRLHEFRAVLVRLARYEADVDAGVEPGDAIPAATLREWIEDAKLNEALYRQYGGAVGIGAAGPYAHGGKAALIAEHVAAGGIEIIDRELERRFRAVLQVPPSMTYAGSAPDFTPFWKRPIPASYVGY